MKNRNHIGVLDRLQFQLPKIVLSPSVAIIVIFVYGFILYTSYLSFTGSKMLPNFNWVGLQNYITLFRSRTWDTSVTNLAIFSVLYIGICCFIGLMLAILLDQKIRNEGFIRITYLYPMALSFIVTGVAWKWILDPGIGLEAVLQGWGWESFSFRWIKERDMAIYTIVIAAVWQTSGFVMATFLAGLRGIDNEMLRAAQLDGASTFAYYRRIVIPQLRPAFMSAFVVLAHMAIKSYDLVIALTGGGPGNATSMPATFMYSYTFTRNQMGIGAASAVMMLMTVAAIIVPYLWSELREKK
ncbi:carbohydrate ABC transporter permease [Marinomonas mediterranea]|uniref:ABC-type transporter, integral membrane subunit n=1 Tax=Marinomonas mediterranea (strain ATCC 700492 / JCM 21426 / NBRC 103028 / MMB-1) TaxID=717774 RepID=F2JZ76_MARM1|nr:sugar ABC transporter permease [Marinomonas mediterranea]ADZ93161.1 ABC-type transporter, integral membrane subunit [Marinomonas mediterranea MMB-1]WCN11064.1 ABC transporter permease subunit [Marinomonas mediterranea]WCN15124.1 ABC transporter permease subunit [Marinomonas mediterranea]WCN19167.1 ABC transporter permease subunit [Marinomonas mediterranea MMB-1]